MQVRQPMTEDIRIRQPMRRSTQARPPMGNDLKVSQPIEEETAWEQPVKAQIHTSRSLLKSAFYSYIFLNIGTKIKNTISYIN
jgi:hypothetical protein